MAEDLKLSVRPGETGVPLISAAAAENAVVLFESSTDLKTWDEWLTGHGPITNLADFTGVENSAGFYRASARPRQNADDWKNLIRSGFEDPFRSPDERPWDPDPRWIKFILLLDDSHRVVFQDSTRYPFHYDFAVARLPRFRGMTRAEFDAVTLYSNGQQAVPGAVLFPPSTNFNEVAIQFAGYDPYSREQIAQWFATVRAAITGPSPVEAFYIPTFEQSAVARQNQSWFEDQGIRVASIGRWVTSDECYATGWALGRLVFVPGAEIEAAYNDGRLGPLDILLTDAVPAEVPPLSGLISLNPATPNSHVALLARSFGIPFVHLVGGEGKPDLRTWDGSEVLVRAVDQFLACEVEVSRLATPLEQQLREDILAEKIPPLLELTAKEERGQISLRVDDLGPSDIRYAGGKAANAGVLRRSIPTNSPSPAIAFTFDLWNDYLAQIMPGGLTLEQVISNRLAGFTWPPDMRALQTALLEVRDLITDTADFSASQQQAILAALQGAGFDPNRNIRFRSSTNVEDSEQFSGAGLYDSFSGCLADDLDADSKGPSVCDPTESKERGVFRALRKVYASFYNDNAVLERLRHRVDESEVGMAVLVHYSTPDALELANGVATLRIQGNGSERYVNGTLVTQAGAESVTNPDSAALPEIVDISHFGQQPSFETQQRSSLVPLGAHVLEWQKEYHSLYHLLDLAGKRWQQEVPGRDQWVLDFEYKKEAPDGGLRIKQIRPLPLPDQKSPGTKWLLNATNAWSVNQGEFGDVLSFHRLKSFWTFHTRNTSLASSNLQRTLFTRLQGEWLENTNIVAIDKPPGELPGYKFNHAENATEDRWDTPVGTRTVRVQLDRYAPPQGGPVTALEGFRLELAVRYNEPQPRLEFIFGGGIQATNTSEENVFLTPVTEVTADSKLQQRRFRVGQREIHTDFYWPPEPKGAVAGYTAPVQAWVVTTLTGFISQPIQLHGEYSQTYHPGHHNFWEEFLFDPWLEPGLDGSILAELTAANIRAIIITWNREEVSHLIAWGLDGQFRQLN